MRPFWWGEITTKFGEFWQTRFISRSRKRDAKDEDVPTQYLSFWLMELSEKQMRSITRRFGLRGHEASYR